MLLSELPKNTAAVIEHVETDGEADFIARRLRDIGFVPGETVRITAYGPWRRDPILVQVGSTRFALRQTEARRVVVKGEELP